jgi:hypothetical protein
MLLRKKGDKHKKKMNNHQAQQSNNDTTSTVTTTTTSASQLSVEELIEQSAFRTHVITFPQLHERQKVREFCNAYLENKQRLDDIEQEKKSIQQVQKELHANLDALLKDNKIDCLLVFEEEDKANDFQLEHINDKRTPIKKRKNKKNALYIRRETKKTYKSLSVTNVEAAIASIQDTVIHVQLKESKQYKPTLLQFLVDLIYNQTREYCIGSKMTTFLDTSKKRGYSDEKISKKVKKLIQSKALLYHENKNKIKEYNQQKRESESEFQETVGYFEDATDTQENISDIYQVTSQYFYKCNGDKTKKSLLITLDKGDHREDYFIKESNRSIITKQINYKEYYTLLTDTIAALLGDQESCDPGIVDIAMLLSTIKKPIVEALRDELKKRRIVTKRLVLRKAKKQANNKYVAEKEQEEERASPEEFSLEDVVDLDSVQPCNDASQQEEEDQVMYDPIPI